MAAPMTTTRRDCGGTSVHDDDTVDVSGHFRDTGALALRGGAFTGPAFDTETPPAWNQLRVLVIGAGGIGCEVLHCLAQTGFANIDVVDMDTIDLTNLNRQFLFRDADIGKPKAEVAAAAINLRCPWARVTGHCGRIEELPDEFYRLFHICIMGLDSVAARKWMNRKYASLASYTVNDETGLAEVAGAVPVIDGGTEGLQGSVRLVRYGVTACLDCLDMYPPRKTVPMCTLENVPRVAEHCVLYAKEKLWDDEAPFGRVAQSRGGASATEGGAPRPVDGDDEQHIEWIMIKARSRQDQFRIPGTIDFRFTQGVVKNVVPAVGFTNALVAAMCVNEAFKLATDAATSLDNYSYYNGGARGVASYAQALERNPQCASCQPPTVVTGASAQWTPQQLVDEAAVALLALTNDAGEPIPHGSALRMVATLPADPEAGTASETVTLMLPPSHPNAAAVAGLASVPLLTTVRSAAVSRGDDAATPLVEVALELSGGPLSDSVRQLLLKFGD